VKTVWDDESTKISNPLKLDRVKNLAAIQTAILVDRNKFHRAAVPALGVKPRSSIVDLAAREECETLAPHQLHVRAREATLQ
jgi:hypothetical protein